MQVLNKKKKKSYNPTARRISFFKKINYLQISYAQSLYSYNDNIALYSFFTSYIKSIFILLHSLKIIT